MPVNPKFKFGFAGIFSGIGLPINSFNPHGCLNPGHAYALFLCFLVWRPCLCQSGRPAPAFAIALWFGVLANQQRTGCSNPGHAYALFLGVPAFANKVGTSNNLSQTAAQIQAMLAAGFFRNFISGIRVANNTHTRIIVQYTL